MRSSPSTTSTIKKIRVKLLAQKELERQQTLPFLQYSILVSPASNCMDLTYLMHLGKQHPQVSLRVNFAFLTSREIRRLEIDTELVKNLESLKCCFLLFQRPLELSSPFEKRSGSLLCDSCIFSTEYRTPYGATVAV